MNFLIHYRRRDNGNILRQIQEKLPKHLQKAGLDIERGEVNSEAIHRTRQLTLKKLESEVRELRKFKEIAEKFLTEHGLKDYFRKAFIHSNNREI